MWHSIKSVAGNISSFPDSFPTHFVNDFVTLNVKINLIFLSTILQKILFVFAEAIQATTEPYVKGARPWQIMFEYAKTSFEPK